MPERAEVQAIRATRKNRALIKDFVGNEPVRRGFWVIKTASGAVYTLSNREFNNIYQNKFN
jgi:hypothetical protein